MNKRSNRLGKYSSKVKRVNIPIPSFEYVHKSLYPDKYRKTSPGLMIGRDRIIEKLKYWLDQDTLSSGSYLITGYRGMGKTCFVERVLYELVAEPKFRENVLGVICLFVFGISLSFFDLNGNTVLPIFGVISPFIIIWFVRHHFWLKEKGKKYLYRLDASMRMAKRKGCCCNLSGFMAEMRRAWSGLSSKEWSRINNLIYGADVKEKRYSNISISINLGQEILDERSILCVLTSTLYTKYRQYVLSPIANFWMWIVYVSVGVCSIFVIHNHLPDCPDKYGWLVNSVLTWLKCLFGFFLFLLPLYLVAWHQLHVLFSLRTLRKRIDAEMKSGESLTVKYDNLSMGAGAEYVYPIANVRDIESQLIEILDRIQRFPVHPKFYFVFDELDKIETPLKQANDSMKEFSNEKYLSSGGTSRKRKYMVMHLLANMKYLTTTAKAKFIFIAGREMYDGYLADLTDRESAISSLFNGVIYVESFCKNEKSEKDVMYNAETFISRLLIPREFIEQKVVDRFIACKSEGGEYSNPDINLKMYYEYLILTYTRNIMRQDMPEEERHELLQDARDCIDKAVGLMYHFTVYLYHISNGSPKKMRMAFEELIRPIKNKRDFVLKDKWKGPYPSDKDDIDICITQRCRYLLSLGDKDQRTIGFIHYISFPVNQIITDANQFGDKLLVAASFLINHLYKYHSGGFSWRNIEQTPELLEVYKIPEFRGFINAILGYLVQTHIIQIPCGLYQFKFRKQISEEISLASKVSEKVSAIFNFTLDESQSVKRHYVDMLNSYQEKMASGVTVSPHTIAGIHHILGDLYMSDEEYNLAIFEYQAALKELGKEKVENTDPHCASVTLAYIRNMLKLGMAFEKRRTYTSAYNTYNEVIDRIIHFREFDETDYGLKYAEKQTEHWPYNEAVLYDNKEKEKKGINNIRPEAYEKQSEKGNAYRTKGQYMISDFSYQLTPEKHTVIQRLAMLEDTQIVYQALLAKLFINEKIELGGITRTNLDVIEGEYKYIHLTANEKEKFLISTDFFRRLGDIMYYKNGLIGFSISVDGSYKKNDKASDSFVDDLYYYSLNIKNELREFCQRENCCEYFGPMYTACQKLTAEEFESLIKANRSFNLKKLVDGLFKEQHEKLLEKFWDCETIRKRSQRMPLAQIIECNERRKKYWENNRTLPCYACKYYNRSLRILMTNLFDLDVENVTANEKKEIKPIHILRVIVKGGSSKSMRQNYMIQLAEVLDCLGNTMLSCASLDDGEISSEFLAKFLHDAHEINNKLDREKKEEDFMLLSYPMSMDKYNKVETCLLYYWEASICFRYGKDMKKAAGSMKKILRVIQNYLRVEENDSDLDKITKTKVRIGEFLNEIKNRIVKQCLICLYSHYNYINAVEIQRLKWIFYVQMYENMSLNRLTLFPDVEEIMLIYYELIKMCIVEVDNPQKSKGKGVADAELENTRIQIEAFARSELRKIRYSWNTIEERNKDFNDRLVNIYSNLSLGALRHDYTMYERILSLHMKTMLNRHILEQSFKGLKNLGGEKRKDSKLYFDVFNTILEGKDEIGETDEVWMQYFPQGGKGKDSLLTKRFKILEFLILDSIYCLTEILDTISPHLTTTLFTHSFIGTIYHSLNQWNQLFDSLFRFYKFFDERQPFSFTRDSYIESDGLFNTYDVVSHLKMPKCSHKCSEYSGLDGYNVDKETSVMDWRSKCPYYGKECVMKGNRFDCDKAVLNMRYVGDKVFEDASEKLHSIWQCRSLSDRLFNALIGLIGKPNIQYTYTNYSGEMALVSYRSAKEQHREGRAYKDMISRMYYIDDELKNDTVQFDLAVERFKINSDYIDNRISDLMGSLTESLYDIENFCMDNESKSKLSGRFLDLFPNIRTED